MGDFTILIDWTKKRILVVVDTLIHNSLETSFQKWVAAKAKLLDNCMVVGQEGAEHKTNLKRRVDVDAPHLSKEKAVKKRAF
jgi:hypothetical protein